MYKKRIFIFLLASFFSLLCSIMIWTYICKIDPLYLFYNGERSEITGKNYLTPNMRLQARGLCNLYDFDSLILGSSMLVKTSAVSTSNLLGAQVINLSVDGSTFQERSYILDYVLSHKNIKNVIYSIDTFAFNFYKLAKKGFDWQYIYSDNKLLASKIYLNRDFLKFLLPHFENRKFTTPDALFGAYTKENVQRFDLKKCFEDNRAFFHSLGKNFSIILYNRKNGIMNAAVSNDKMEQLAATANLLFVSVVKNNPQTNFYFIIPPYWRGTYARQLYCSKNDYSFHQAVIKYFVQLSAEYKNMFVYCFELEPFVDDLKNYTDTAHYHPEINVYMMECIKNKKNLLTVDIVDEYLAKAKDLAANYDIERYLIEINNILKENNLTVIEY